MEQHTEDQREWAMIKHCKSVTSQEDIEECRSVRSNNSNYDDLR